MKSTVAVCLALAATACNKGNTPPPGGPGGAAGPPAAPVKTVTLQTHPIEQTSEFIATIQSLRSTTVQPEVDGTLTRIFVKAGDRVRQGTPLVQINPDKQRAAVNSAAANRAGTEADVVYWRQQVKRLQALVDAGAISRQEFEQAQNSLKAAEAKLAALDAQVKQQEVELRYYRVVAPQAGMVGDITLRPGDRVTSSTVITTIDSNQGLEVDIEVPLDRSPELHTGLPVQVLDANGSVVATNPITFVAPRVDERTQTVLVKSLLRNVPPSLRVQQFVRARIVWQNASGVTVPVTAVTRINGKFFCFVVEQGDKGTVARQRPLELGDMIGNEYVVRGGLKPGDRLIVSGIQKIGDGAPVRPE